MTELEKLKAGLEYCYDDEEVDALKERAIIWCQKFNALDPLDFEGQRAVLEENLGSIGEKSWIAKTFNCDNGKNIHIGSNFTGNYNLTILDIREVYIGDNVMIGPNTLITTVGHPLTPMGRRKHIGIATPVRIGNDVWIGGNVTILPGVTIGNNVVVAAGAVVTKDIPDNTLVGGVPAKKIKDIENDTEEADMQTMELKNGVKIPAIGYGTWQSPDSEITVEGVKAAISNGYRHIDTAAVYGNEQSVGKGIAECGIPREKLFITSKVWNTERGYEKTLAAFEKTIKDLGVSYLDLYLIHWPAAAHMFDNWEEINLETWRAMTDLYKAGKIKAIGVSNFKPHHLKALMETEVKPMVNQIEFHPGLLQEETVSFCRENGILVEAWSPLGTGRMLTNHVLQEIAGHYEKSVAQVCIRWAMQHGVLPLPKSVTPSRIEENFKVLDFEIDANDMKRIDALDNFGGSGLDPDKVDF